ncbi:hypothetical protein CCHR01_19177 [Colletotrichum chrysophilum]|uniref:Uncharacterized protein n=1 Tax=Colletotrichum chrysophilum TaxID=1836956 RepID=A0AAD8ZYR8_9PEZI|nr:hypothetical protein K456DRAFT_161022 [Colletotrichum gloeosporioides 23]KAK1838196.1 hypothetical protein CCHR01_19177 [Colletotrichum chrysophilum]
MRIQETRSTGGMRTHSTALLAGTTTSNGPSSANCSPPPPPPTFTAVLPPPLVLSTRRAGVAVVRSQRVVCAPERGKKKQVNSNRASFLTQNFGSPGQK